jgi:hypothetical protein
MPGSIGPNLVLQYLERAAGTRAPDCHRIVRAAVRELVLGRRPVIFQRARGRDWASA